MARSSEESPTDEVDGWEDFVAAVSWRRRSAGASIWRLQQSKPAFTFIELIVVVAISAVLISLLVPAVTMVTEAARRAKCKENLLQLGSALGSYHMAHNVFPPGVVTDWYSAEDHTRDRPHHWRLGPSWLALLLPQVGQQSLYNAFNAELPTRHSGNATVVSTFVSLYVCPSSAAGSMPGYFSAPSNGFGGSSAARMAKGSYVGNWGAGTYAWKDKLDRSRRGVFGQSSNTTAEDIRDGSSNTVGVSEMRMTSSQLDCRGAWAYGGMSGAGFAVPREMTNAVVAPKRTASPIPPCPIPFCDSASTDEDCVQSRTGAEWVTPGSYHAGTTVLLMMDGSVRSNALGASFEDLLTISGSEF